MDFPDFCFYELKSSIRTSLGPGDDCVHFVDEIEGEVVLHEESEEEPVVGKLKAHLVHLTQARRAECSLFEVFDSIDDEFMHYYDSLFSEEDFRSDLPFDGTTSKDVLLMINRMEILPKHRGHGLGLEIMSRTIDLFGRDACVAIQPFPLTRKHYEKKDEWGKKMKIGAFGEKEHKTAREKLRQHWGQLGFRRVKGTDIFLLDSGAKKGWRNSKA